MVKFEAQAPDPSLQGINDEDEVREEAHRPKAPKNTVILSADQLAGMDSPPDEESSFAAKLQAALINDAEVGPEATVGEDRERASCVPAAPRPTQVLLGSALPDSDEDEDAGNSKKKAVVSAGASASKPAEGFDPSFAAALQRKLVGEEQQEQQSEEQTKRAPVAPRSTKVLRPGMLPDDEEDDDGPAQLNEVSLQDRLAKVAAWDRDEDYAAKPVSAKEDKMSAKLDDAVKQLLGMGFSREDVEKSLQDMFDTGAAADAEEEAAPKRKMPLAPQTTRMINIDDLPDEDEEDDHGAVDPASLETSLKRMIACEADPLDSLQEPLIPEPIVKANEIMVEELPDLSLDAEEENPTQLPTRGRRAPKPTMNAKQLANAAAVCADLDEDDIPDGDNFIVDPVRTRGLTALESELKKVVAGDEDEIRPPQGGWRAPKSTVVLTKELVAHLNSAERCDQAEADLEIQLQKALVDLQKQTIGTHKERLKLLSKAELQKENQAIRSEIEHLRKEVERRKEEMSRRRS